METKLLIEAGKAALHHRYEDGESSTAHNEALAKIDEITHNLRATHPDKFWVDGSKEYRKLTDKWQAERAARAALKKAASK
jgi:hypothetical protein